jgi:hypothetical protein
MEMDKILKAIEQVETNLTEKINGIRKDLKGLVEIQQRLIHERLNVQMPPSPVEYGEETPIKTISNSNSKIQVSNFGQDHIKISGKTYDYNPIIKASGQARWEKELKVWTLPVGSLDTLLDKFKENNVSFDNDVVRVVKEENEEDYVEGEFSFIEE